MSHVRSALDNEILSTSGFDPDTDQALADTVKANLDSAEQAVETAFSVSSQDNEQTETESVTEVDHRASTASAADVGNGSASGGTMADRLNRTDGGKEASS